MFRSPVKFPSRFFDAEWLTASALIPRHRQKLMIVLHGRGDSIRAFRTIREELDVPEMNYLLLNAPRKFDDGFSWYPFTAKQGEGVVRSREKLFGLMKELRDLGWLPKDIFFLGFSQGCLMCVDFGLHFDQPLAGIIGMSGYAHFFPNWKSQISATAFQHRWLVTHGTRDKVITLDEARGDFSKLTEAGLPIDWVEFDIEHEFDLEEQVPFIQRWILDLIRDDSAARRSALEASTRTAGMSAALESDVFFKLERNLHQVLIESTDR